MRQNKILIIGFAFFGLIIGYTSGITTSEISKVLITCFFGFIGGKAFVDLRKDNQTANNVAGLILILFSVTFIVGLNVGIFIKINKLLTMDSNKSTKIDYLRNSDVKNKSLIEQKYRNGEITCDSIAKIYFRENEK